MIGLPRDYWTPSLTTEQVKKVVTLSKRPRHCGEFDHESAAVVAFHSKGIWPDEKVAKRLAKLFRHSGEAQQRLIARSIAELGVAGCRPVRKNS
jgi:hypothetical protein